MRRYGLDLLERVLATGALTGLGEWIADERLISITQTQGWRFALFLAFLSLVKGVVARTIFERDSASLAPLGRRPAPREDELAPRDEGTRFEGY